jgi:transposase
MLTVRDAIPKVREFGHGRVRDAASSALENRRPCRRDNVLSDLDIHLVMDNSSTHKTPTIRRWLLRHPRWHVHFTPTSSSSINQVERFFANLTEHQISRGVHRSTRQLEKAIRDYIKTVNEAPKPFRWTKSADHPRFNQAFRLPP